MAVSTTPGSLNEQAVEGHAPRNHEQGPARAAHRLWLGPAAWLMALLGISMLGAEPGRALGGVLVLASAVLTAAWGGIRPLPAFSSEGEPKQYGKARRSRVLSPQAAGIAASALVVLLANLIFLLQPGEKFGPAGWLWLAGMALLVLSTARLPRSAPGGEDEALRPSQEGVRSTLPVRRAAALPESAERPHPPVWARWEVAALVGLALLALVLRAWNLRAFPDNIYPDEIMTGQVAAEAYLNAASPHPSIFSTLWGGIDLPALWFALVAAFVKAGGSDLGMLRLPAALFGAAAVVPFYGLVRAAWGRYAALAGTAVMAFSASNVHYGRVALNNIVTPFFWTVCFFFLLRGLRSRRPVDWALAGIAAGLSEYSYYGTRLLPFILAGFLLYLITVHRQRARCHLGHFALLALGYLAGFGPLLAYYLGHPRLYFGHGSELLIWNRLPTGLQDVGEMWSALWPALAHTLLGVSTLGSQDVIYFAPLLLAAEAALLAVGVGLLVRSWRHPAAFLILLSGLGVLFVGGTLVRYAPSINHWTPAFPAFYAALAVPVGAWAGSWRFFPTGLRRALPVGLALGLALLAWLNIDFYFRRYYADPGVLLNESYRRAQISYETITAQSRYAAALGPRYRVFTVTTGPPTRVYDPQTTMYLVKGGVEWANIPDPTSGLPVPGAPGKGTAFIFFPEGENLRGVVSAAHPGGTPGEVRSAGGALLFYTYVLPPR